MHNSRIRLLQQTVHPKPAGSIVIFFPAKHASCEDVRSQSNFQQGLNTRQHPPSPPPPTLFMNACTSVKCSHASLRSRWESACGGCEGACDTWEGVYDKWEGACDRCEGAYLPRCAIAMPHGSHDGIHHLTGQVQVPEVISLDETISKRRPLCSTPASPQCMSCKNWYI